MADQKLFSDYFATAHLWDPDALDYAALADAMNPNNGGANLLNAAGACNLVRFSAPSHPMVIATVDADSPDYIAIVHSPHTITPVVGGPVRAMLDNQMYYMMGNRQYDVSPCVVHR